MKTGSPYSHYLTKYVGIGISYLATWHKGQAYKYLNYMVEKKITFS